MFRNLVSRFRGWYQSPSRPSPVSRSDGLSRLEQDCRLWTTILDTHITDVYVKDGRLWLRGATWPCAMTAQDALAKKWGEA